MFSYVSRVFPFGLLVGHFKRRSVLTFGFLKEPSPAEFFLSVFAQKSALSSRRHAASFPLSPHTAEILAAAAFLSYRLRFLQTLIAIVFAMCYIIRERMFALYEREDQPTEGPI